MTLPTQYSKGLEAEGKRTIMPELRDGDILKNIMKVAMVEAQKEARPKDMRKIAVLKYDSNNTTQRYPKESSLYNSDWNGYLIYNAHASNTIYFEIGQDCDSTNYTDCLDLTAKAWFCIGSAIKSYLSFYLATSDDKVVIYGVV